MTMKLKQKTGGALVVAIALASMGAPAHAQDAEMRAAMRDLAAKIEAMQAEQKRMQAKLDAAEKKLAAPVAPAPASAQAVTGGDIPGSFKLPGSNTSVSLGGFVKAVVINNSRSAVGAGTGNNAGDQQLSPTALPLSTTPVLRRHTWNAHARESRIILRTSTPTSYGPVTTLIEADFFGAAGTENATNPHGMRLRHAWGSIGKFSAGQYWSNAVNLSASPENIDQVPNIAMGGAWRQPQVRWTEPLANGFWAVSLENPESSVILNSAGTGGPTFPDNDKSLDLTGRYHWGKRGARTGEWEVTGALRKIRSAPTAAGSDSKLGGGISVSGYLPVGTGRVIMGLARANNGGRFLGGLVADGILIGSELKGIDVTSGYVAYRHFWTPKLRTNLNYARVNIDNPDGYSAATRNGLNKKIWTVHLNTIWQATPQVELGVEFLRALRQVESGVSGDLSRVTFMGKYSF